MALKKRALLRKLKKGLEASQITFTKYFFRVRGDKFLSAEHHAKIDEALLKLERGELLDEDGNPTNNLLITISPRWGKTQIISIDWPARCIAKNPKAKFIHLSYSDDLVLDNSGKCREIIASPEYQELWPIKIKSDSDSKKKWTTTQGGGMYATAAGGPVTGFGAGSLEDIEAAENQLDDEFSQFFEAQETHSADNKFYGAIIIDDPIKVDDAYNEKEREKVNKRLNTTIKSRRNSRNTALIIVMQRLHEDDMAGFVLAGGMGEKFHHLNLPAGDIVAKTSHWPEKHTWEELEKMMRADRSAFMAQMMQDPTPEEGTYIDISKIKRFRLGEEPTRLAKYGAGDFAVTENDGDWTELGICGFDFKDDLWFLDWFSGQVRLDKGVEAMFNLHRDHDPMLWTAEKGIIRRASEPLIEAMHRKTKMYFKIEWLAATQSKAVNAKSFQALVEQGKVHIPYGDWGDALIEQLAKFTGRDDKVDDKVDVCGQFGRVIDQAFGPAQYHENMKGDKEDDYGSSDDDGDTGDWRTA